MASSYHRRIHVIPEDVAAGVHTFVGNGVSLLGMYMYHGGTNPVGLLSTMQESQITGCVRQVYLCTGRGVGVASVHGLRTQRANVLVRARAIVSVLDVLWTPE
jgi:hypothetical protein